MYTYIHTCIHTYTLHIQYNNIDTSMRIYIYTYRCIYIYIYMYTHTDIPEGPLHRRYSHTYAIVQARATCDTWCFHHRIIQVSQTERGLNSIIGSTYHNNLYYNLIWHNILCVYKHMCIYIYIYRDYFCWFMFTNIYIYIYIVMIFRSLWGLRRRWPETRGRPGWAPRSSTSTCIYIYIYVYVYVYVYTCIYIYIERERERHRERER